MGIHDDKVKKNWRFFAVYASTNYKKRKDQWRILHPCIKKVGDDCLVMGDFNDILDDSEKTRGNYRLVNSMQDFRELVAMSGLMDLDFIGRISRVSLS